jgi:hypothetical protein
LLERYARSSSLLFGAMEKEINTSWTIGPAKLRPWTISGVRLRCENDPLRDIGGPVFNDYSRFYPNRRTYSRNFRIARDPGAPDPLNCRDQTSEMPTLLAARWGLMRTITAAL